MPNSIKYIYNAYPTINSKNYYHSQSYYMPLSRHDPFRSSICTNGVDIVISEINDPENNVISIKLYWNLNGYYEYA